MLLKSMRIYFHYFLQFVKTRAAYKGDFLAALFSGAMVSVTGVIFIMLLLDGRVVPDLKGWQRSHVLFIYGYSVLATCPFSLLAVNLYAFGEKYIIEGNFDRVLLRPLNSLFQVLCESFSLEAIGNLIVGFTLVITASNSLNISYGFFDIVWFIIGIISGGLILLSVFVILASLSFHFEDRLGIAPPFYNLITFSRYPLPIYNRSVQFILSWLIPFGFVGFYPATHFFDRTFYSKLCYLTPLVALVCVLLASLAWRLGVSRYSSTGN